MKEYPIFQGKVKDGKMIVTNRRSFDNFLVGLGTGLVSIEIMKWTNRRTLSQNAYYWLYLGLIASETGDDPKSLHKVFKQECLPPAMIKVLNGKTFMVEGSTTELTKSEFSEYLDKIAVLTEVPLPDPNLEIK